MPLQVPLQVEDIQREMQQVRANLSCDVRSLAQRARDTTDWRFYVRHYPWACLGAVAATGFLLVPRKKQVTISGLAHVAKDGDRVQVKADRGVGVTAAITSMVIRFAANALMRRGMDLLSRRATAETYANTNGPNHPAADAPRQPPHSNGD